MAVMISHYTDRLSLAIPAWAPDIGYAQPVFYALI